MGASHSAQRFPVEFLWGALQAPKKLIFSERTGSIECIGRVAERRDVFIKAAKLPSSIDSWAPCKAPNCLQLTIRLGGAHLRIWFSTLFFSRSAKHAEADRYARPTQGHVRQKARATRYKVKLQSGSLPNSGFERHLSSISALASCAGPCALSDHCNLAIEERPTAERQAHRSLLQVIGKSLT